MKKTYRERIEEIVAKKGGTVLSKDPVIKSHSRIKIQCSCGYLWNPIANGIIQGSWCKKCAAQKIASKQFKFDIDDLKNFAVSKNGECLSHEYIGSTKKYIWRCEKGHEWDASWKKIKIETWCPYCAKNKIVGGGFNRIKQIIESKNGHMLGGVYKNQKSKFSIRCHEGHEWKTSVGSLMNGSWCPTCAGKTKLSIEEAVKLASSYGGVCLSKEINGFKDKLLWKCKEGHKFKKELMHVRNNSWCMVCSSGKSERICKAILEKSLNVTFYKVRPKWLKYTNGNRLELDGYCEEQKIAFEYQGIQHYKFNSRFHKNLKSLQLQIEKDEYKKRECERLGIKLIQIPTIRNEDSFNKIFTIIKKACDVVGVKIKVLNEEDINLNSIYSPDNIAHMKRLAVERGGLCLDEKYLGSAYKYKFKCKVGHVWSCSYSNLRAGKWCPFCAGKNRTITDMKKLAKSRNGECISSVYINERSKLSWKCEKGHIWDAAPGSVVGSKNKKGTWCPICGRLKASKNRAVIDIETLKTHASNKGGKLLSSSYIGYGSNHKWRCDKGHEWNATPSNVIGRGTWCKQCNVGVKRTIDDIKKISKNKKGDCVSKDWKGMNAKYKFKCENGHAWEMTAASLIYRNNWCKECKAKK